MIDPAKVIYLDNNATTRLDPAVVAEMIPYLEHFYANPSSGYGLAREVRQAIDHAREQVAALLGCVASEIIFTSSGTESINAALHSALKLDPARRHIVTTTVEHSAVLRYCEAMAGDPDVSFTQVGVDAAGGLDLAELERAIRPETAIVSVMWANNETGVIFPVQEIAEIARRKNVLFHTDAVQAAGKLSLRAHELGASFLSVAAHKFHGPKGMGALYVNRGTRFRPMLFGGSHESKRRAGTENVASIVGMGIAAECALKARAEEEGRVRAMRDMFESELLARLPEVEVNGDREHRLPNTTNLAFARADSAALLLLLDQAGVCCSAASACRTGSLTPSRVLTAMKMSPERAGHSVRFSFGRFNADSDVRRGVEAVVSVVSKIRQRARPVRAVPA